MDLPKHRAIDCRHVELDGVPYVILRESAFDYLCREAGIDPPRRSPAGSPSTAGFDLDRASLAEKLVRRRLAAGLSQAELARRAGIRPETLNRIERGRTTPDFATIRKLVLAINAAERERLAPVIASQTQEEPEHDGEE
jgi:DNA-binding XRE family transcriptional regulator